MKFSVAMAVYKNDKKEWLDQALTSIFNQTLMPDEVILVVDGPISLALNSSIQKYLSEFSMFRVIKLEENKGHGNARRIGLSNCSHEWVALMDSDDICSLDRFEKQIQIIKLNPELSVVGGQIEEFIGSSDNVVGIRKVPHNHKDIISYMRLRCPFNQVTVMLKKSDVLKAGGYIDWFCNEDYYLWIRMFVTGSNFYNLKDTLVYVRVGEEMYQRRGGIKYFLSETKLQLYMWKNGVINTFRLVFNVIVRFLVQILMPNKLRSDVFKFFFRERIETNNEKI